MADLQDTFVRGDIHVEGLVDDVDIAQLKSDYDSHSSNTSNPHNVGLDQARSQNGSLSSTVIWNFKSSTTPSVQVGDTNHGVSAADGTAAAGTATVFHSGGGGSIAYTPDAGSTYPFYVNNDGSGYINGQRIADRNWVQNTAQANDADMVDGKHASAFVESGSSGSLDSLDLTGTIASGNSLRLGGHINFDGGNGSPVIRTPGGGSDWFRIYDDANSNDLMRFNEGGAVNTPDADLQERGNRVATRTWVQSSAQANDADTVDGEHASAFLHASGDTLTGDITTNAGVRLVHDPSGGGTGYFQVDAQPTIGSDNKVFFKETDSSTDKMAADLNNGWFAVQNKIGVGNGVSEPSTMLDVNGGSTFSGRMTIDSGVSDPLRLEGDESGDSNVTFIEFHDSSSRKGYVGDGSSTNSDIYVGSDTGGVRLISSNGSVLIDGEQAATRTWVNNNPATPDKLQTTNFTVEENSTTSALEFKTV